VAAHPILAREFEEPLYGFVMKMMSLEPMVMTVLPYSAEVDEIVGIEIIELAGNRFVCDMRAATMQAPVCELLAVLMEPGDVFFVDGALFDRLKLLLCAKVPEAATAVLNVFSTYAQFANWTPDSAVVLHAMLRCLVEHMQEIVEGEPPELGHLIMFFEAMWRVLVATLEVQPAVDVCRMALALDLPAMAAGCFSVRNPTLSLL